MKLTERIICTGCNFEKEYNVQWLDNLIFVSRSIVALIIGTLFYYFKLNIIGIIFLMLAIIFLTFVFYNIFASIKDFILRRNKKICRVCNQVMFRIVY